MGDVYRATDTTLGRQVAIKVLAPSMRGDADRLARFRREATAVAVLNHPNIVTVYSVEEGDGMPFLTMELVEGRALDRLSERLPRGAGTHGVGAWMVLLASIESAALLGRREQPAALYPLVRQLMEHTVTPWGFGLVGKAAGIAASASRAWAAAEAHFASALRMADAIPHRVEQADVRRWQAQMLLDRNEPGDRERARALLTDAGVAYAQVGMPRHVAMVDDLLKDAGQSGR